MKYEYKNATGKTEIEVDEQFYDILINLDNYDFNSDRKHSRRYPISLENCEYEGEWFNDGHDTAAEIDSSVDMNRALASLTELQRICFVETRLKGKSQREVAAELGKSRSTVQHAVDGAIVILKKFFD